MKNRVLYLLLVVLVTGCYKDELPVAAHEAGSASEVQIEMGQDYRHQIFYSLGDNQVVSSNEKTVWDLAFESAPNGWHIVLNTARGMAVHRSTLNFADLTSEQGLDWNWDVSSGNLDSTAVGEWTSTDALYVIDMGYDHLGTHLGYRKMKVLAVDETAYTLAYGNLSDATALTFTVQKNDANLFTYFKFGAGTLSIAPPNTDWDLEFTQYTHLFTNPAEPYLVTGVLLNRFTTTATRITNKPFEEITYADVVDLSYSNQLDYIGYTWKTFDYANQIYAVDPTICYIIHTSAGFYYKLHFIDFYNDLGVKGYPTFEVQLL
ncbi:MAG: hypothetical protein A3D92_12350 [Bacteroidetes bacterium RIFCSPHIGHO2_02_FULL_44_7]|nr:MAG: hypothetical protein A3D92_12350 [Bacteroidetes bacterium RIFCSPHIGHO2_02_FULL_44_7]